MPDNRKIIINQLREKGVNIPCPDSVEIGVDIDPERISGEGVIIHTGCKLFGDKTLIMPGAELGYEGPATIHNCQLGKNVKLGAGFFSESCFLDGVRLGSGAQVREACLFEEGARGAHAVGVKHTILFPFVTLGSLINFCDCLMAGGTDEKNHSEVGSSYIHFNYTPNQDKATASLIGDVPRGVMINQQPIFLGGQGGLVGPLKIGYGIVVGAGNIVRKDLLEGNTILVSQASLPMSMPFNRGLYPNIRRIIIHNIEYISNLMALRRWYLDIRSMFMHNSPIKKALLKGALDKLDMAINERIERLGEVAGNIPRSIEVLKKLTTGRLKQKDLQVRQEFLEKWPEMEMAFRECLKVYGPQNKRDAFAEIIDKAISKNGKDYLTVIKSLDVTESSTGTAWLQGIVEETSTHVMEILPRFKSKKAKRS